MRVLQKSKVPREIAAKHEKSLTHKERGKQIKNSTTTSEKALSSSTTFLFIEQYTSSYVLVHVSLCVV